MKQFLAVLILVLFSCNAMAVRFSEEEEAVPVFDRELSLLSSLGVEVHIDSQPEFWLISFIFKASSNQEFPISIMLVKEDELIAVFENIQILDQKSFDLRLLKGFQCVAFG